MPEFQLQLNTKTYVLEAEPSMPLLWVIRDLIGLKGTKYGCGIGQCGACTVHLDRTAIRACQVPISAIKNRAVTTVEGLGHETLHPVQEAWKEIQVPQCGYCQSGQIMSAVALLSKNAKPTNTEIANAMRGNLCRCGTYDRIKKGIALASSRMTK